MAHKKAQGAATQKANVPGKRLGIKKHAGEDVKIGNIIVRQRGSKFHPGRNTSMGKDHTIFAMSDGKVSFRNMTGTKRGRKAVDVIND